MVAHSRSWAARRRFRRTSWPRPSSIFRSYVAIILQPALALRGLSGSGAYGPSRGPHGAGPGQERSKPSKVLAISTAGASHNHKPAQGGCCMRRNLAWIARVAVIAGSALIAHAGWAQDWPVKPV